MSNVIPYFLFFLSGFAALVYEVSWNRQLGLTFGHTASAAAVVLAAYFGGMAIGYAVGGRVASRVCPFRGYAVCEFAAGMWALAIPAVIQFVTQADIDMWLQIDNDSMRTLTRVVFSLLLLAPTTISLGATLPMMNEMLVRWHTECSQHQNRLLKAYSFNTLGALAGVVFASSWSLAAIGVTGSSQLAAIVSVTCALSALLLPVIAGKAAVANAGGVGSGVGSRCHEATPVLTDQDRIEGRYWFVVAIVSGAGTLALEVLYTRLFSLIFHNSTYTFSFILISFLLGLSLSAIAAQRLLTRSPARSILSSISCWAAVAVTLSVIVFVLTTRLDYFEAGRTFTTYYLGGLLLVFAVTLPVAFLAGIYLPVAWSAGSNARSGQLSSRDLGHLTLANTIAAASGALTASFVLFPFFGLWKSFAVVAMVLLIPAILSHSKFSMVAIACCLPIAITNPERWVRNDAKEKLLNRWHSAYGWIDVVQDRKTGEKKVQQNLHYRFGATGGNAEREFRQAHLPLLLHPEPRDVLFLGLGTGMTAGGAVPHRELKSIEVVELIPEVVEAVRLLGNENRHIVDDPRTKIIVDDARHFLSTTTRTYDVIISDLFVPWESETGYLYTVEQFTIARKQLRSGGLFCQWLPLYQLGVADFEMIADSLRSVFPHVTLWWGRLDKSRPILALVASENRLQVDEPLLRHRLNELMMTGQFDDSMLATPTRIVELCAGDWPQRLNARLNTDEHPWLEFQTPISHRNGKLFKGAALRDYQQNVLEHNPSNSIQYTQAEGTTLLTARSWQRLVMFPEP